MRKILFVLFFITTIAFAEDPANYAGAGFQKNREVMNQHASAITEIGTSSQVITIPYTVLLSSVVVENLDDTGVVYVNSDRGVVFNIDRGDGVTTAGDNTFTLGAAVTGLQVGDLIVLDEGDADDGIYLITAVTSTTIVELDKAPTLTKAGTQDYKIQSSRVSPGKAKSFSVGTSGLAIVASEANTSIELTLTYQKRN